MAAATAIPGVVFSGARDGVLRAYSTTDGKVIWSYDTVREFETVNKVPARGGSIDGPGPVIVGWDDVRQLGIRLLGRECRATCCSPSASISRESSPRAPSPDPQRRYAG